MANHATTAAPIREESAEAFRRISFELPAGPLNVSAFRLLAGDACNVSRCSRLLAGFRRKGGHPGHENTQAIAADLVDPRAAFTAGLGHLVLASAHEVRVYATARGEARLLGRCPAPPGTAPVLRLLAEPRGDDFRVVHTDGVTRLHRVTSSP